MDGLWNAGVLKETTTQAELSRHRLLRINLSNVLGLLQPGDASSFGAGSPLVIPGAGPSENSGPHFILSSVTPDNSHCYGFEFFVTTVGLGGVVATPPYTITIWELIGTSVQTDQSALLIPIWASLLPVAGILNNELFHTFDVNACAIRFQIVDAAANQDTSRSIIIGLAEL